MLQGEIEQPSRYPNNCLDVLAQQVIACVAMEPWDVPALFELVRAAYPFHDLSGRGLRKRPPAGLRADFRPRTAAICAARVVWDRVHNRLAALPGPRDLALIGGGTIPDTGQFPVYLGDGGPRLGELDEEFVLRTTGGRNVLPGQFHAGGSRQSIRTASSSPRPGASRRSCRSGAARTRRARPSSARRSGP